MSCKVSITNFVIVLVQVVGTTLIKAHGNGCRTPDRDVGTCVLVKDCQPMLDIIEEQNMPTIEIFTMLNIYYCGSQGKLVKVCCPNSPATIRTFTTTKSTQIPSTSDVSTSTTTESTGIPVTQHKNLHLLPTDCGTVFDPNSITYGNKTSIFEFPWMALLYRETDSAIEFLCAGTVINKMYVLTAAHCIANLENDMQLYVRVGEHNIFTYMDCEESHGHRVCAPPVQDIRITHLISHPSYDKLSHTYDIGLVRLISPLNTEVANVQPICLPAADSLRFLDLTGESLIVTGWGITEKNVTSPELLKALIDVTAHKDCQRAYDRVAIKINNKQICAGGNLTDACGGDSGGPLQYLSTIGNHLKYVQYGVVSFGAKNCGRSGLPGVYTRVDHYMNWILDHMEP